MKKLLVGIITGVLVLSMGVVSFASTFESPADEYANLMGISVEEARLEKGDKTFGQMADENGILDEFRVNMLELKKERLADLVEEGVITQERADEILSQMDEDCTLEPGSRNGLMKEFGMKFGSGNGTRMGNGNRTGTRMEKGMGNRFGQNNTN